MRPLQYLPALVLALALAPLSGCSSTSIAYDNADWLLKREINRYTCPSPAQEEWLEREIEKLHRWHRQHELPRYARTLRALAWGLKPAQRTKTLEGFFAALEAAGRRFTARISQPAAQYLAAGGAAQRRCLTKGMKKQYDKNMANLGLPRGRYIAKQLEKLEDRLDDWVGDLTTAQKSAVDKQLAARHGTHREMAAAWGLWGARLVKMLKEPGEKAARIKRLKQALSDRFALYTESERKLIHRWDERNREMTRTVARLLTPNQSARLKKKLLKLAGELEEISRDN